MFKGRDPGAGIGDIMVLIVGGTMLMWGIMLFVVAWSQACLQNLIWNATTLGGHHFASEVGVARLFSLMVAVRAMTVLTLGLYQPFGVIRIMKYRLECVAVLGGEILDEFAAGAREEIAALGEETA